MDRFLGLCARNPVGHAGAAGQDLKNLRLALGFLAKEDGLACFPPSVNECIIAGGAVPRVWTTCRTRRPPGSRSYAARVV